MKHLVAAVLLSCPLWVQAAEPSHQFEIQGEVGTVNHDDRGTDIDDEASAQGYLGYEYLFDDTYALGVDYLTGESSDLLFILPDLFKDDGHVEYAAWEVTGRATTWVSQRNALYAKLRLIQYEYDVVSDKGGTLFDGSGLGGGVSLGWRYQFDMGLGMGLSANYRNLGGDIELVSLGYNLSFRF